MENKWGNHEEEIAQEYSRGSHTVILKLVYPFHRSMFSYLLLVIKPAVHVSPIVGIRTFGQLVVLHSTWGFSRGMLDDQS